MQGVSPARTSCISNNLHHLDQQWYLVWLQLFRPGAATCLHADSLWHPAPTRHFQSSATPSATRTPRSAFSDVCSFVDMRRRIATPHPCTCLLSHLTRGQHPCATPCPAAPPAATSCLSMEPTSRWQGRAVTAHRPSGRLLVLPLVIPTWQPTLLHFLVGQPRWTAQRTAAPAGRLRRPPSVTTPSLRLSPLALQRVHPAANPPSFPSA